MPAGDPGRLSSLFASPYDLLQGLAASPSACVLGGLAASSITLAVAGLLALPPARPLARGQMTLALISMRPGGRQVPIPNKRACAVQYCLGGTVRGQMKGGTRIENETMHGMRYVRIDTVLHALRLCTLYMLCTCQHVRPPVRAEKRSKEPQEEQRAGCEQYMLDGDMTSRRRLARCSFSPGTVGGAST